jgi:NADH/NAD ratio-sensing transcriptional regulator Rex
LHHHLFQLNESLNSSIEVDIGRIKEYTKLLHSLSHNVVVEMTKLKIEEENLKIKARILEKDFEFLGRREKALEDQVLK